MPLPSPHAPLYQEKDDLRACTACTAFPLGTQFLLKAVAASAHVWQIRFKLRDEEMCRRQGMDMAGYVKPFRGRDRNEEAEVEEESDNDPPEEPGEEVDHDDPPHMMEL